MTSFTDQGGKIQFNEWGLVGKGTVTTGDPTHQTTSDLTLKIYNQSETFQGSIIQNAPGDYVFSLNSSSGADHFSMEVQNGIILAGAQGTINGHTLSFDGFNWLFT